MARPHPSEPHGPNFGGRPLRFTKYEQTGALHWGKLAGRGPRTYHARLRARYGWFVSNARGRSGLLLDVGCGDGALAHLLAEATPANVVGVEPEPRGIELAEQILRERGSRVRVASGVGESLPAADGAASTLVLCEVIEHVDEPAAVLREAARVLGPDGLLLLSTPQRQSTALAAFHEREYTAAELAQVCSEAFGRVEVRVSEPDWLIRAYALRPFRLLINCLSILGANPFRILRKPGTAHDCWRQLYVAATVPRKEEDAA